MIKVTLGVLAVILDEKKRVLLERTTYLGDRWQLPGGFVEEGEPPESAFQRELREELGVEIKIQQLAGIYYKIYEQNFNMIFLCEIICGEINPDKIEVCECKYFKIDSLPKELSQRSHIIIKDCVTNVSQPFVKTFKYPDEILQLGSETHSLI